MVGRHLLSQWSRTQHMISLSSGEAQLHAICTCASEGLALRNISVEMGLENDLELLTDSSAAKRYSDAEGGRPGEAPGCQIALDSRARSSRRSFGSQNTSAGELV